MTGSLIDERVLLMTPTGGDTELALELLSNAEIEAYPCASIAELCEEVKDGAGALLLAEEALVSTERDLLAHCLEFQETWSDIPVIILATAGDGGYSSQALMTLFAPIANVTLLERPFQAVTLITTVRAALRARHRQYEVRDLLISGQKLREEQRTSIDALRESEERLRLIMSNVKDHAILTLSPDGSVTSWNVGAEKVFGYSESEMVGKSGDILFTPEDRERQIPAKEMMHAMKHGSAEDKRWHVRKDGARFYASGTMESLKDEEGVLHGFVKVIRDSTEQKKIETERELLLESERAARFEAERVGRMKDEFLATLSHELRTPLNAILGWSQLLRRARTPEDLSRGLDIIERNTRLQSQLIEDLLDMSSIISGKVRLDIQKIEVRDIVESAVSSVQPTAQAKGIQLIKDTPERERRVSVDSGRAQQILWNLLTNAIKFTPPGGKVHVSAREIDSQLQVQVKDTGRGIRSEFLPFVFERFRQEDASTTRNHGGLGLGLSIVKNLVELHGGTIHVESPGEGKGATFTVMLPLESSLELDVSDRTTVVDAAFNAEAEAFEPPDLTGKRILVVDDDQDARELVRRILNECGAEVVIVSSALEALEALQAHEIHLLISDISMPQVDGYELIERMRQLPGERGSAIPGVAVTAFARSQDRARALDAGYEAHVSKPIKISLFLKTVSDLIAGRPGLNDAVNF